MDNQEAELKVAQEVPFITGQFTNTGTTTSRRGQSVPDHPARGSRHHPQGHAADHDRRQLRRAEDLASRAPRIGQKPAGAVDLITNKRTITTNVLIEDGGIVVLGGLIEHDNVQGENACRSCRQIPLIGRRSRRATRPSRKNNLMIFIRPKILRDDAQAAYETDSKYKYMMEQEQQAELHQDIIPLLPGEKRPRLPPMPPPPPPGDGCAPPRRRRRRRPPQRTRRAGTAERGECARDAAPPAAPPGGRSGRPPPGNPAPQEQATPDEARADPQGRPSSERRRHERSSRSDEHRGAPQRTPRAERKLTFAFAKRHGVLVQTGQR